MFCEEYGGAFDPWAEAQGMWPLQRMTSNVSVDPNATTSGRVRVRFGGVVRLRWTLLTPSIVQSTACTSELCHRPAASRITSRLRASCSQAARSRPSSWVMPRSRRASHFEASCLRFSAAVWVEVPGIAGFKP